MQAKNNENTFYQLLVNSLIVTVKNSFVWFALTFWIYLETKSVISTALVGGIFMITMATTSTWTGTLVDKYKKKNLMAISSVITFILFTLGLALYLLIPQAAFRSISNPALWIFVVVLLAGAIAGQVYSIALPTLVTVLVPEDRRDKANGLVGIVMGIAFAITSFASGLAVGFGSMTLVLIIALVLTVLSLLHLLTLNIPENKNTSEISNTTGEPATPESFDLKTTINTIKAIPGLFALIFFTTFNNLVGGVFMALMDAYGLTLVSVEVWGAILGCLSLGFIIGGMYITKKGLGENPLKNLFRVNIVLWIVCIFFTIQPSIVLLVAGMAIWMSLIPIIEATEQTIIQKVIPAERQGRVFGFAHSIEQIASPLTAFIIGPITQIFFIPFMTTGAGVQLIGSWFGTGEGRGIALVFSIAGIVGLIVTLVAMRSQSYKLLAQRYMK
jgi:DHA3 family multidrug efflux protein-like MFS transporter